MIEHRISNAITPGAHSLLAICCVTHLIEGCVLWRHRISIVQRIVLMVVHMINTIHPEVVHSKSCIYYACWNILTSEVRYFLQYFPFFFMMPNVLSTILRNDECWWLNVSSRPTGGGVPSAPSWSLWYRTCGYGARNLILLGNIESTSKYLPVQRKRTNILY